MRRRHKKCFKAIRAKGKVSDHPYAVACVHVEWVGCYICCSTEDHPSFWGGLGGKFQKSRGVRHSEPDASLKSNKGPSL